MLTKEQIEEKEFTLLYDLVDSIDELNNRWIFIADRKTKNKVNTDIKYIPCLLEYYYNTGEFKITDYFNDTIHFKEYYFIGIVKTEKEFNSALDTLDFTIEEIEDINTIKIDYP